MKVLSFVLIELRSDCRPQQISDVDFIGNDSVIRANSIETVVRLTVFEAILPFFPTEYVVKSSFFTVWIHKCP